MHIFAFYRLLKFPNINAVTIAPTNIATAYNNAPSTALGIGSTNMPPWGTASFTFK